MRTVTITVQGRVQGVGFRYALRSEAQRLGLAGWVRNRRDGSVEAVVSGSDDTVDALISWAHRGPTTARVSSVAVHDTAETTMPGFEVRPTD